MFPTLIIASSIGAVFFVIVRRRYRKNLVDAYTGILNETGLYLQREGSRYFWIVSEDGKRICKFDLNDKPKLCSTQLTSYARIWRTKKIGQKFTSGINVKIVNEDRIVPLDQFCQEFPTLKTNQNVYQLVRDIDVPEETH